MSEKIPQHEDEYVFRIPESQSARLRHWILESDTKVAKDQLKTGKGLAEWKLDSEQIRRIRESIERGEPLPNYGMIGGAYTYSFTPNSIGVVIKVENTVSGDIIDLSQYDAW